MEFLSTDESAVMRAAALLRDGGLVAFPTETVYGLGADAFDAAAVARIFEAKQRPAFDPLIVHVSSLAEADAVGVVTDVTAVLIERFWPGPLTVLLPKRAVVPGIVTSGLSHRCRANAVTSRCCCAHRGRRHAARCTQRQYIWTVEPDPGRARCRRAGGAGRRGARRWAL